LPGRADLIVLPTNSPAGVVYAFLIDTAADTVAAGLPSTAVAIAGACPSRRMTTGRGIEIARRLAIGDAAALAALIVILARLLERKTPGTNAVGAAQAIAAIVRSFAGLAIQRAAATRNAGLSADHVLAAVAFRLAGAAGVAAAGAAFAGAEAAAVAVVAARATRVTAAALVLRDAGRVAVRGERTAAGIAAAVVGRITAIAEREADGFADTANALAARTTWRTVVFPPLETRPV
jgi:hypothetical protein